MSWVQTLASPRWAVAFFLGTAAGALAVLQGWSGGTTAMVIPLGLLIVNLVASIVVHRRFRADIPLLLFHLALVALVALFVIARLTYLEGVVTVLKGARFDGRLHHVEKGPLHDASGLAQARFTNLGFVDRFRAEGRVTSRNTVEWNTGTGFATTEIGTDLPLIVGHYRIYTSHHRGLAAILDWIPDAGSPQRGAVEFAVQRDGFAHGSAWTLDNGIELWATLDIPTLPASTPGSEVTDFNAGTLPHSLILRVGDERHVLGPSQSLALPGGKLTYRNLESWMGYRVLYDPTRPWLLASVALGVASLIWFYTRSAFLSPRRI